jgi:hypothetical protein
MNIAQIENNLSVLYVESDEERLEYLFKLYEQMIAEEKKKGTLFEEPEGKAKIKVGRN